MLTKEDLEKALAGFGLDDPTEEEVFAMERVQAEVDANRPGTIWLPQGPLPAGVHRGPININYNGPQ